MHRAPRQLTSTGGCSAAGPAVPVTVCRGASGPESSPPENPSSRIRTSRSSRIESTPPMFGPLIPGPPPLALGSKAATSARPLPVERPYRNCTISVVRISSSASSTSRVTISISSSASGPVGVPRIVTCPRRLPPTSFASRPCRRSSGSSNSSTAPCGARSTTVRPGPPSSAERLRSESITSVQGTRFTRPSGSEWYCLKSSRICRLSSTIGSSRSHEPSGNTSPRAASRLSARARMAAACSGESSSAVAVSATRGSTQGTMASR